MSWKGHGKVIEFHFWISVWTMDRHPCSCSLSLSCVLVRVSGPLDPACKRIDGVMAGELHMVWLRGVFSLLLVGPYVGCLLWVFASLRLWGLFWVSSAYGCSFFAGVLFLCSVWSISSMIAAIFLVPSWCLGVCWRFHFQFLGCYPCGFVGILRVPSSL